MIEFIYLFFVFVLPGEYPCEKEKGNEKEEWIFRTLLMNKNDLHSIPKLLLSPENDLRLYRFTLQ